MNEFLHDYPFNNLARLASSHFKMNQIRENWQSKRISSYFSHFRNWIQPLGEGGEGEGGGTRGSGTNQLGIKGLVHLEQPRQQRAELRDNTSKEKSVKSLCTGKLLVHPLHVNRLLGCCGRV